ncbi:MAG TPA: hypothetical protein VNP37_04390 [Actinomycetospora sp.]|nr:hypothetical protein [Actinomycetospora sp.]
MQLRKLLGRVVVVMGASSGVGRATGCASPPAVPASSSPPATRTG